MSDAADADRRIRMEYNDLPMLLVRRLSWDNWNIAHIARHGITQDEVEAVCHGNPTLFKQSYKDRLVILGPNQDGRILAVIIGPVPNEPSGVYYAFTARPADRAERRFYDQEKGGRNA